MIDSNMKVRDVATGFPFATKVLEQLKIDYCCGGERPLSEACEIAGIPFEALEQKLSQAQQEMLATEVPTDFQKMSLTELINYIIDTHHVFTKNEMERLEALTVKVIAAHGANHPELISIGKTFQTLCADLKPHMFKEEQILFPYVATLDAAATQNRPAPFPPFGTVNNPIRMMMLEHDTAGVLLRELRQLSSDYVVPPDGCLSYKALYEGLEAFERDLHQHIHLEANILFPKAIEVEKTVMTR